MKLTRFLPSGLIIFAGVVGITAGSLHADEDITKIRKKFDLREAILRKFMKDNHCPNEPYASEFISEADANNLDWRLMPSLSLVETGCGREAHGNNVFGWNNGHYKFSSISEAIHTVAEALASARPYKDRDLKGKLASWNRNASYGRMVVNVMNQIAPSSLVEVAE